MIALVFFVIYQQIENAVLQPIIMKRTVNINPLAVLLSVLIGVRLMGLWGALFAIPVASCAQIFVAAMWHEWQRDKLSIPGALPD